MTDLGREQADAHPGFVTAGDRERDQAAELGLAGAFAEQFDGGLAQPGEMQVEAPDRAVLDAEGGVGAVVDQGLVGQVFRGGGKAVDQDRHYRYVPIYKVI